MLNSTAHQEVNEYAWMAQEEFHAGTGGLKVGFRQKLSPDYREPSIGQLMRVEKHTFWLIFSTDTTFFNPDVKGEIAAIRLYHPCSSLRVSEFIQTANHDLVAHCHALPAGRHTSARHAPKLLRSLGDSASPPCTRLLPDRLARFVCSTSCSALSAQAGETRPRGKLPSGGQETAKRAPGPRIPFTVVRRRSVLGQQCLGFR